MFQLYIQLFDFVLSAINKCSVLELSLSAHFICAGVCGP